MYTNVTAITEHHFIALLTLRLKQRSKFDHFPPNILHKKIYLFKTILANDITLWLNTLHRLFK